MIAMDILRFGLIGCGKLAHLRVRHLPSQCLLVAAYDPDHGAVERLTNSLAYQVSTARSANEVVQDPDIDVIIVATPHAYLASHAIQALRAGKHCFIEKPGGASLRDIQALHAASAASTGVLGFGFNHRFHPAIQLAHKTIRERQFGNVISIRGTYGHGGRKGYEKEWRANKEISGGGELVDQGSHLIDLVIMLLGNDIGLEYSHLTTRFWNMSVEDNAFLAVKSSEGALAWLHASWTEWKNLFRLEINLEQARIDIQGLGKSYGQESLTIHRMSPLLGPPTSDTHSFGDVDVSWKQEMEHFISGFSKNSEQEGTSIEDLLVTWRIIEDAYSR